MFSTSLSSASNILSENTSNDSNYNNSNEYWLDVIGDLLEFISEPGENTNDLQNYEGRSETNHTGDVYNITIDSLNFTNPSNGEITTHNLKKILKELFLPHLNSNDLNGDLVEIRDLSKNHSDYRHDLDNMSRDYNRGFSSDTNNGINVSNPISEKDRSYGESSYSYDSIGMGPMGLGGVSKTYLDYLERRGDVRYEEYQG